jgi:hypothetical protein
LDEVDVLNGGDLDGLLVVVQPGVCVSGEEVSEYSKLA